MPIILAIEPDRHQASILAAAVRRRVAAELNLADGAAFQPVASVELVELIDRLEPVEAFARRDPFESVESLEPDFDLSDEIAALAAEPDDAPAVEEFAGEPVGVYTMPALDEDA